jgi:glucose dehydrogenase
VRRRAWPLLAVAAVLLMTGAWRAYQQGFDVLAASLHTAGCITLGVWLATEVAHHEK